MNGYLIWTTLWLATYLMQGFVQAQQPAKDQSTVLTPIARVIGQRCIGCHSGPEPEGEVDLTRPSLIAKGRQLDADPIDSQLWQLVRDDEMPPENKLSDDEKAIVGQWIANGAASDFEPIDPFAITSDKRAGYDWWSLQPIVDPPVPKVAESSRVRNPIDAFLLRALESRKLSFSVEAEPRDQIRRLYFDLTGLPAPFHVIEAFENSPTDHAYARIVDQLLDSAEYGERWGRHWLDIVRYGESDGFERNAPRHDSWRYRDWVIHALNQDLPFDEFTRRQLAGDILCQDPVAGMAATGFLVAGVHNTVVGSSKQMKLLARQDEMEDLVGIIGQTFVGMTFNCARCHDHKFDPITHQEYYQLVATVAGVNHGRRQSRRLPDKLKLETLQHQADELKRQIAAIEQPIRQSIISDRRSGKLPAPPAPKAMACWEFEGDLKDKYGKLDAHALGHAHLESGAVVFDGDGDYLATEPLSLELTEKTLEVWVQLDHLDQRGGAAISIESTDGSVFDAIVFGERQPASWMAGSNGFSRTDSFGGPPETVVSAPVHFAITYALDGTITGYRNGLPYGQSYNKGGPHRFTANSTHLVFGLRHLPATGNRLLRGKLLRAQLYDRALTADEVAASAGTETNYVAESELIARMNDAAIENRRQLNQTLQRIVDQRKELENQSLVSAYSAVYSKPGDTHFLPRGDVMTPGPVMQPGAAQIIQSLKADFALPPDAGEAERRIKLAQWVTHDANPLFPRVIVNRLWHYHFGRGLVATPNDLGFNGGLPSHPELLDWLASQLRRNDYRLKSLHRRIVTSSAWRQSSMYNPQAAAKDTDNRWLWRSTPTRLDAEVIRDSMLAVSGQLNRQRGGPGYADVKIIDQNNGSTYYLPFDAADAQHNRRTVYRFSPRGGRSALLDSLDCPDPSTATPQRSVTTTPLQALSLLNNDFVIRMSDDFANRALAKAPNQPTAQIDWMFRSAYGRHAAEAELNEATKLADAHGLSAVARAIFNSNEFIIAQ